MSVLTDLLKMKKEELEAMAAELNVPTEGSKRQLAGWIIQEQKQRAAASPVPAVPEKDQEQPKVKEVKEAAIENSEFESLVNGVQADQEDKKDGRGGVRPGAGRPKGSTAEICAVRSLPTQPNEAVKAALEALFTLWSMKVKVDEVRLTKDEAVSLALPMTQLLCLYCGDIPQWLHIWIMALWTTYEVTEHKIQVILAVRKSQQPRPVPSEVVK